MLNCKFNMEHPQLIRSQILDSCRLALPEGLKDLMSDITREVLRAQPPDLYTFITEYLSALIITRDSLSIACKICRDVCECSCLPHLEEELRYMGLDDAEVELVKDIVFKYFEQDEVKETNLLMKLFKDTNIDEDMLEAIQGAVRRAFLRHQMDQPKKYMMPAGASQSVENTLRIYQDSDEDKNVKVTKIQALFRGYLVRKNLKKPPVIQSKKKETNPEHNKLSFSSVSSQSLAGSHLHLPRYVPYSALDMSYNESEEYYDDSLNCTRETLIKDSNLHSEQHDKKKIGFNNKFIFHEIDPSSCPKQDGCIDDGDIEEHIQEDKSTEDNVSDICDEIEELSDGNTGGNTDGEMVTDNEPKASFSRAWVQKNKEKDEDNGVEYPMNFGALDDGKSSKNGRDNDFFDLCESNGCPDFSDEEMNLRDSEESIRTLNNVNRDYSIMIKPVHEVSDLKTSLSKLMAKSINAQESDDDSEYVPKVVAKKEALADLQEKIIRERRYSVSLDH